MEDDVKLHVVVIPWLAFGHMIPFLELSKCLAKRGHRVSFISNPHNIERLPTIPVYLSPLINLVKLTPLRVDGMPEKAESTVDVSLDYNRHIMKLQDGLEAPIRSFLKEQHHPFPDWIIYDMTIYWAPRVAHAFGIRCAFFSVFSAATLSSMGPPSALLSRDQPQNKMSPEQLMVPQPWITIPSNVVYRYHEAVQIIKIRRQYDADDVPRGYRLGTAVQGCDLVAIRSAMEFEPDWMRLLTNLYQKPILPVGFLSPSLYVQPPEEEEDCSLVWEEGQWLDTQNHGSTVYVAFGSELRLTQQQVTELAFGLELSQLPFFWAYRGDTTLLPMGFEDRTKGRGIVRMGWAPQSKFLAHPSVGGFLMHGGWGSTIEALSFAKPLIMLPMIGDQGLITRVMEEKKVGVEVGRNNRDGSFTRDAIAKALKLVMVESEGEPMRSNASEMQKLFADKVRHDQYIDELVQHLINNRREQSARTPLPLD